MIRKIFAFSLALWLLFSLSGCEGQQPSGNVPESSGSSESSSAPESSSDLPDVSESTPEEESSAPELPEAVAVTGLLWNKSVDLTLEVGVVNRRTVTVSPEDAADKAVTYTSSNPAAATVDASGLVVCVAPGVTTITAAADSAPDITVSYTVTVVPKTEPPPAGSSSPNGNWAASEDTREYVVDEVWAYAKELGARKYVRKDYPGITKVGDFKYASQDNSEEEMIKKVKAYISLLKISFFEYQDIICTISFLESYSDANNYILHITIYGETKLPEIFDTLPSNKKS